VEEVVLATSGEDAFEIVFAVAAAIVTDAEVARRAPSDLRRAVAKVAAHHPSLGLGIDTLPQAGDDLLGRVGDLLARTIAASAEDRFAALDAVFESLVPRVSKAAKGQFFTPRHVVEFIVRMLAPRPREVVLDPACGSGAFLAHARAHARVDAHGSDIDLRAVRVARLLALAARADPSSILRADGLRSDALPPADVIATNPPFAGRASVDDGSFELAGCLRSPERDVLFLERAVRLLRPGGRLGIVLPYNKANGTAFAPARQWLVERARVLAVVGLPKETFLPHTGQRTVVIFARKRKKKETERERERERVMFLLSEKAGKDTGGEPIYRERDGGLDHDLDDVGKELAPFLRAEGFGA
jgi:type I restriction enzyme M protein